MDEYDLDQREEDLTLLLHAWPDIEEALLKGAADQNLYSAREMKQLADAVRQAFRVEVQEAQASFLHSGLGYVLLYDVNSYNARQAAVLAQDISLRSRLDSIVSSRTPLQGYRRELEVQIVPSSRPVRGEVCPRVMVAPPNVPDLRDLPEPEPPPGDVAYVIRGLHKLTHIEAPFYDALQDTDLVFAVQPRVQGDRVYRPDFVVFYGGRGVVVEIDGHEGHKTVQQRNDDTERERWFQRKGLPIIRFTGSQVIANPKGCVKELLDVLRGHERRP